MNRRSLLQMIGLAPVAATVKIDVATVDAPKPTVFKATGEWTKPPALQTYWWVASDSELAIRNPFRVV